MNQPLRANAQTSPKKGKSRRSQSSGSKAVGSPSASTSTGSDLNHKSRASDLESAVRYVNRLYKLGYFDSQLRNALVQLNDCCRAETNTETPEYWKGRNLLYELNEILDFSSQIPDQVLTDGYRIKHELRMLAIKHRGTGFAFSERKLLREKALFLACYAHEIQRRGEKHVALEDYEWLAGFVTRFVKTEEFPCFGTQAVFCFHMGSILRKLELHHRAESMFSKALELLYERAKHRTAHNPIAGSIEDQLFVIRKQAMIIGLGFGLLNMSRGALERAEHAFTTAKSLLGRSGDPLIPAYIELQCGVMKRCRAGTSPKKLLDVITTLERARDALTNHNRHRIRACWELALARTLYGDLSGARKDLQLVERFAEEKADQKWLTNVHILRSRMLRKEDKLREALEEAELAVEAASSYGGTTVLAMVDALITRGEVRLALTPGPTVDLSECTLARADFNEALRLISGHETPRREGDVLSNPKIIAVCKLRLAQTYAREGDESTAQSLYSEWTRLDSQVEHEWVRELAVLIKEEINRVSRNFSISAVNSTEWDYSATIERLRRWLATRALSQTKQNYSEAAKLIGVQRATLYQWVAETSSDTKRRARRPNGNSKNQGTD